MAYRDVCTESTEEMRRMQLVNTTPGKNGVYLKSIVTKVIKGEVPEPLSCNVMGVLSSDRSESGLFCTTPCGREYRVTVQEKKEIEKGTNEMLALWCDWARAKLART